MLHRMAPQLRGRYRAVGYRLFGTLENCPQGHALFFMTKHLVP
jgi:hypothetical protein